VSALGRTRQQTRQRWHFGTALGRSGQQTRQQHHSTQPEKIFAPTRSQSTESWSSARKQLLSAHCHEQTQEVWKSGGEAEMLIDEMQCFTQWTKLLCGFPMTWTSASKIIVSQLGRQQDWGKSLICACELMIAQIVLASKLEKSEKRKTPTWTPARLGINLQQTCVNWKNPPNLDASEIRDKSLVSTRMGHHGGTSHAMGKFKCASK
jgi:hypothetical protein